MLKNATLLRRESGEYALHLELPPEDWGSEGAAVITNDGLMVSNQGKIVAYVSSLDDQVVQDIVDNRVLYILCGTLDPNEFPVLNECRIFDQRR